MNTFRTTLTAAAILIIGFASQAQANGRPSHGGSHGSHAVHGGGHSNHNYHVNHGTRFSHGYFYNGRNHSHWSQQRFDRRYGCTCYFDSGCNAWYYWCQPAGCYYPVSYCPYGTYCWN